MSHLHKILGKTNAKTCDSCGAEIVFLKSARTGKSMPINAHTVEVGDEQFDHTRHESHFATCPDAARFRNKRK